MPGVKGWTVVYRGSRLKAEIIAAALGANGLDAQVFGDSAYTASIDFTDARLMVPDGQARVAQKLIREAEEAEEADDAHPEPPEPEPPNEDV